MMSCVQAHLMSCAQALYTQHFEKNIWIHADAALAFQTDALRARHRNA